MFFIVNCRVWQEIPTALRKDCTILYRLKSGKTLDK